MNWVMLYWNLNSSVTFADLFLVRAKRHMFSIYRDCVWLLVLNVAKKEAVTFFYSSSSYFVHKQYCPWVSCLLTHSSLCYTYCEALAGRILDRVYVSPRFPTYTPGDGLKDLCLLQLIYTSSCGMVKPRGWGVHLLPTTSLPFAVASVYTSHSRNYNPYRVGRHYCPPNTTHSSELDRAATVWNCFFSPK